MVIMEMDKTYIYWAWGQSIVGSNNVPQLLDNLYKYCKGRNKKICDNNRQI